MKSIATWIAMVSFGLFQTVQAAELNTVSSSNSTSARPLVTQISVTPSPDIRFKISAMNASTNNFRISTGVDSTTVSVTAGVFANQVFSDPSTQATYYGYYLSSGVTSAHQSATTLQIKIRKGASETPGRSFYMLGNGTSTPKKVFYVTGPTEIYTTFAHAGTNTTHCGPNYVANHLVTGIRCDLNSTVANMDITQFVKVMNDDPDPKTIISQLEFVVMPD